MNTKTKYIATALFLALSFSLSAFAKSPICENTQAAKSFGDTFRAEFHRLFGSNETPACTMAANNRGTGLWLENASYPTAEKPVWLLWLDRPVEVEMSFYNPKGFGESCGTDGVQESSQATCQRHYSFVYTEKGVETSTLEMITVAHNTRSIQERVICEKKWAALPTSLRNRHDAVASEILRASKYAYDQSPQGVERMKAHLVIAKELSEQ